MQSEYPQHQSQPQLQLEQPAALVPAAPALPLSFGGSCGAISRIACCRSFAVASTRAPSSSSSSSSSPPPGGCIVCHHNAPPIINEHLETNIIHDGDGSIMCKHRNKNEGCGAQQIFYKGKHAHSYSERKHKMGAMIGTCYRIQRNSFSDELLLKELREKTRE